MMLKWAPIGYNRCYEVDFKDFPISNQSHKCPFINKLRIVRLAFIINGGFNIPLTSIEQFVNNILYPLQISHWKIN